MLTKAIARQQFILWIGGKDKCRATARGNVEPIVRADHRPPGPALGTLFDLPHLRPGLQIETVRCTVLFEHVDVLADNDPRTNALRIALGVMPEAVLRDVALA